MLKKYFVRLKIKLWKNKLPLFTRFSVTNGNPYDYYDVYFLDVNGFRYNLVGYNENVVTLGKWDPVLHSWSEYVTVPAQELLAMQEEIIHFRRHGPLRFNSITLFSLHYYTRMAYVKNFISRTKGLLSSALVSRKEVRSRDRIILLDLLLTQYIRQPPSQVIRGISENEVIDLLYGKLWYKHIRNEEFRRKIKLILQSLVITEDLSLKDERYFIEGKAISTIVAHEKEDIRDTQQIKMQKNIVRLMIVISLSILIITLAILSQAGVVDLGRLWQYILNIKPLRFLLKFV